MALALNSLQPYYVTNEAECALARSHFDSIAEKARLIAIVMDSIREVVIKPAHENKQLLLKRNFSVDYAIA